MELINIFDDLKNGMSIENIIKKYKIGLSRLIKIVRFHNNTGINYEEKIIKEIYNLREQGIPYEEIAKTYNASAPFINNFIKKYCAENDLDVPKIKSPTQKLDLSLQDIYNMRKNGISIETLSNEYDVSNTTIRNKLKEYCNENDLDVPKVEFQKEKLDLPMQEIYNMKKNKISTEEISWKYDVNESTIYSNLKKYCDKNNLDFPKEKFQNKKLNLSMQGIYDMEKRGVSIRKISMIYDVSYTTIRNRLKEIYLGHLLYLFQSIIDKENDVYINHFTENETEIDYSKQINLNKK